MKIIKKSRFRILRRRFSAVVFDLTALSVLTMTVTAFSGCASWHKEKATNPFDGQPAATPPCSGGCPTPVPPSSPPTGSPNSVSVYIPPDGGTPPPGGVVGAPTGSSSCPTGTCPLQNGQNSTPTPATPPVSSTTNNSGHLLSDAGSLADNPTSDTDSGAIRPVGTGEAEPKITNPIFTNGPIPATDGSMSPVTSSTADPFVDPSRENKSADSSKATSEASEKNADAGSTSAPVSSPASGALPLDENRGGNIPAGYDSLSQTPGDPRFLPAALSSKPKSGESPNGVDSSAAAPTDSSATAPAASNGSATGTGAPESVEIPVGGKDGASSDAPTNSVRFQTVIEE